MANKENLLKMLAMKLGPEKMQQMADRATEALMAKVQGMPPGAVDKIIKVLEFVMENPEQYPRVLAEATKAGALHAGTLPPRFDPIKIGILLLAFYGIQSNMRQASAPQQPEMQMAVGGLARFGGGQFQQNPFFDRIRNWMQSNPRPQFGGFQGFPQHPFFNKFQRRDTPVGIEPPNILYGGNKQPLPEGTMTIQPVGYAQGGLAALAAQGRNGDTMLAHITPEEAMMLKAAGGSGTINPHTGLPEFFDLGSIFSSIGGFFDDSIGAVFGAGLEALPDLGLGLTADTLGDIATGAVTGAAVSGLTGGNMLTGALTGGFGASPLAGTVGNWIGEIPGIGQTLVDNIGAQALGAGLMGGVSGALTGQDPIMSALMAGGQAGMLNKFGAINNASSGLAGAAGATLGGTPAPEDYYPTGDGTNVIQGAASPSYYPSPAQGGLQIGSATTGAEAAAGAAIPAANSAGSMAGADWMKMGMLGLSAMKMFGGLSPQQAQQEINKSGQLTKEQKEALARPLTPYLANWNASAVPQQGQQGYDQYQDALRHGREWQYVNPTITKAARGGMYRDGGGALSQVSRAVSGPGGGREDLINAKLSDGEYVIDAETVALLGDGSTESGAGKLDAMREQIRRHKGKTLAKGKISPNAKGPLSYMKGGLR